MALKLDIKNDTLIPSQAFKKWADEVLTERGMETSVQIPVIGALFKRNKNLQGKLEELKTKIDRCPAGSDVWFSKMFLWPFGGKVTDDAESYFNELGKKRSLDELETAARQAAADRQTNGTKLDAACAAALNLLENPNEGLPAAVGALSLALSSTPTAAPAGAAPAGAAAGAAPAKGTKAALIAAFTAEPESARLIYPRAQNPASQDIKNMKTTLNAALIGVSPGGGRPRRIDSERKAAAKKLLLVAGIDPKNLAALTESYSLDDSTLAPVAESRMFSSLDILLESGRITQEDYNRTSKRLLRTSSIINEEAPPTPAAPEKTEAEKTAAIAANKVKFDGFVSSIAANCTTLATELKGLQTLGKNLAKQTVLGESVHRQVIKSHIKKRILQETAGKDSREQLNEFFLIAALLAALTGAIAWAAAKIGDFFKGSEYGRGTPTYSPRATPEQATKAVEALSNSITAGYGPDGMLVDAAGRRVVGEIQSKQAVMAQLDFSVQNLTAALTLFGTIQKEAEPGSAAAGATELAAYLGVTEAEKIKAAGKALVMLDKYKNADTIGKAVEAVKAALQAV